MTERKEILDYGMTLLDVYIDAPFHDDNWILLRYKKNKRAFAWTYERNGSTAGRLYRKYVQEETGMEIVVLPSTSPANAAYSVKRLVDEWKGILEITRGMLIQ